MDSERIKLVAAFADDFRFAMSWGLCGLGICVLFIAAGIIWEWKETKPKDEKFWFVCGVFFHWLSTVNARILFLLNDSGAILDRTEHLLTAINLVFAFIAGCFYFRALTAHWKKTLWRCVGGIFIIVIMVAYAWRVLI